jgi:hypothetical protein
MEIIYPHSAKLLGFDVENLIDDFAYRNFDINELKLKSVLEEKNDKLVCVINSIVFRNSYFSIRNIPILKLKSIKNSGFEYIKNGNLEEVKFVMFGKPFHGTRENKESDFINLNPGSIKYTTEVGVFTDYVEPIISEFRNKINYYPIQKPTPERVLDLSYQTDNFCPEYYVLAINNTNFYLENIELVSSWQQKYGSIEVQNDNFFIGFCADKHSLIDIQTKLPQKYNYLLSSGIKVVIARIKPKTIFSIFETADYLNPRTQDILHFKDRYNWKHIEDRNCFAQSSPKSICIRRPILSSEILETIKL